MSSNSYSSTLDGNIMILGKTGSGKTSLVQRWGLNGFFKVNKVYWVSSLELDENRKTEIDSSFTQDVVFTVAPTVPILEKVIRELELIAQQKQQQEKADTSDTLDRDFIGEKTKYDALVVFDDMSTIADKSRLFGHFLTVSRKFNYVCVYIFHMINSKDSDLWNIISSQTHIYCFLNIGTLSPKIKSLISDNCIRSVYDKNTYLPRSNMWLTKLITGLSNNHTKEHVLIDNRESCSSSCKIRSRSDELKTQICYYPIENDNRFFNKYTTVRDSYKDDRFVLSHLVGNTLGGENIHFKLREESLKLDNNSDSINNLEEYIINENGRELFPGVSTTTTTTATATATDSSSTTIPTEYEPKSTDFQPTTTNSRNVTKRDNKARTYPRYSYKHSKRPTRRITTLDDISSK